MEHQALLHGLEYLIAPIEVLVVCYLAVTMTRTVRRFRDTGRRLDVLTRLKETLYDTWHVRWGANAVAMLIECQGGTF